MSEYGGKDDLDKFAALIPGTPALPSLASPGSTGLVSKTQAVKEINKIKKKYKLLNSDNCTTSEELATVLINAVIRPRAELGERESIELLEKVTAWLDLHNLKTQAKFKMTSSFWTHLNVSNCTLTDAPEIVKAIDPCYIDILIEATSILDSSTFRTKFLQNSSDYMGMNDYIKKGENTPKQTLSNKKRTNEILKLPALNIEKYEGDLYGAETLMKNIINAFDMKGVGDYLEDEELCSINKHWSEAFVANICFSIRTNEELSYIAANNKEKNCARFYQKLHSQIYTTETNIGIMNASWSTLLQLTTEDECSFNKFYSSFMTELLVLKEGKSKIAQDEGFLRMFLHEAIQIDSLKQMRNDLLTDSTQSPLDILKKMKVEITASCVSRNILHDHSGNLNNKKMLRQLKSKIQVKPLFLPRNTGNKVPTSIYNQLASWFALITIKNKTPTQEKQLLDFKWTHGEQKKPAAIETSHKVANKRKKSPNGYMVRHTSGEEMSYEQPPTDAYYEHYPSPDSYDSHYPSSHGRGYDPHSHWGPPGRGYAGRGRGGHRGGRHSFFGGRRGGRF